MVGKQMAIDSDSEYRCYYGPRGGCTQTKIAVGKQLFGSMDGATKYVKGDATAGLIITGINIVGGIVMGMLYGGAFHQ